MKKNDVSLLSSKKTISQENTKISKENTMKTTTKSKIIKLHRTYSSASASSASTLPSSTILSIPILRPNLSSLDNDIKTKKIYAKITSESSDIYASSTSSYAEFSFKVLTISSKRPSIRVESHRSSPTKLYDFEYKIDMSSFPVIKIKVFARTLGSVPLTKQLQAMNWKANVYVSEEYPKVRLAGRVCTSHFTVSPPDLDFTGTQKKTLDVIITNISAFPLRLSITPTSSHITTSCTNLSMSSSQQHVIRVSSISSSTSFWKSSLKLQNDNNTTTTTQIIAAYGSSPPLSTNYIEMSPISFSGLTHTSVVSRHAVTIINTSKSKSVSNLRLSTSNSNLLWFEFTSEYSSEDEEDEEDEEEDEEEDNTTERSQQRKRSVVSRLGDDDDDDDDDGGGGGGDDDDPERSELIGTDADAYHDEEDEDISFRRHPRASNKPLLSVKSPLKTGTKTGEEEDKHRRYVEDLPKLGPQRTMTLNLCFCPNESSTSYISSYSEHFRVFLHGKENRVLISIAGMSSLSLSLSLSFFLPLSIKLTHSPINNNNNNNTGTAKVASSRIELISTINNNNTETSMTKNKNTTTIQCSDVRQVTIRNVSIVRTRVRIEGPSASASSFLIRPRHLVLEPHSSERVTITRVKSRISSCRANYVLRNLDGGNSLELEVVSLEDTLSSGSGTTYDNALTSLIQDSVILHHKNSSRSSSSEHSPTMMFTEMTTTTTKTTTTTLPTPPVSPTPPVMIDMGQVTGDYPLSCLYRLDSNLTLSWNETQTGLSIYVLRNDNVIDVVPSSVGESGRIHVVEKKMELDDDHEEDEDEELEKEDEKNSDEYLYQSPPLRTRRSATPPPYLLDASPHLTIHEMFKSSSRPTFSNLKRLKQSLSRLTRVHPGTLDCLALSISNTHTYTHTQVHKSKRKQRYFCYYDRKNHFKESQFIQHESLFQQRSTRLLCSYLNRI